MRRIIEAIKNRLAVFMLENIMPSYEAHKRAALMYTSAEAICLRKDLDKTKTKLKVAQGNVRMFRDLSEQIVTKSLKADQTEITPLVFDILRLLDEGKHHCDESELAEKQRKHPFR